MTVESGLNVGLTGLRGLLLSGRISEEDYGRLVAGGLHLLVTSKPYPGLSARGLPRPRLVQELKLRVEICRWRSVTIFSVGAGLPSKSRAGLGLPLCSLCF